MAAAGGGAGARAHLEQVVAAIIDVQLRRQPRQLHLHDNSNNNSGLPLPPANPNVEKLYRLSDEERQWALELKAAVEASEELENLADLWIVQFVLTNPNRGDLESTLQLVRGLQEFRHEYKIEDTFEDGMKVLTEFCQANPQALLSVAYDDFTENYGLVYDRTRFQFRKVRTPQEWRIFLGCPYYLFTMLVPDPYSMRQGIFLIGECDGMQRSHLVGAIEAIRTLWDHLLAHLPIHFRSIKFFHTNLATNIAYSLMKPFLPKTISQKIMMGCQFGANISSLYLMPNHQAALARTLRRMEDFLRTRYENQATYSLSEDTESTSAAAAQPQQQQQQVAGNEG